MFFKKNPQKIYIDLGSYSYKYLTKRGEIVKIGERKLPSNIIRGTFSNIEIDFESLKKEIEDEFKKELIDIFLLCPDQFVKLIYVSLDKKGETKDDREYTIFRIKKELDKSISKNVFIDYSEHFLEEENQFDKNKRELNVFLANEKLIKSFSEILNSGNMRLEGISSTSSSIINSIVESNNNDFLLINLGYEVTTLSFVNYGIMFYQRVVEIAGRHMITDISKELNMGYDEAVKKLETDFILPNLKIDLEKSIKDYKLTKILFSRLINEINVTIRFYMKTYDIREVSKIYLTGGLSLLPGLGEFIGKIFNVETEIFEVKKSIEFKSNMVSLSEFSN